MRASWRSHRSLNRNCNIFHLHSSFKSILELGFLVSLSFDLQRFMYWELCELTFVKMHKLDVKTLPTFLYDGIYEGQWKTIKGEWIPLINLNGACLWGEWMGFWCYPRGSIWKIAQQRRALIWQARGTILLTHVMEYVFWIHWQQQQI